MQTPTRTRSPATRCAEPTPKVPGAAIVILCAALAAAWTAAGSMGLMGHALSRAICWVMLAVIVVAGWPRRKTPLDWAVLGGGIILSVAMTASSLPVVHVLGVTVVLAAVAWLQTGLPARLVLIAALATLVFGIFRLMSGSIPVVWLAADKLGGLLGSLAGWMTGRELVVGATFGGVDFLVLMGAVYAGWLASTAPPRRGRAIYAAAGIFAGHLLYLILLAFCSDLLGALPAKVVPQISDTSRLGIWTWGNAARSLLPWNLPLLAGLIQVVVASLMFRWAPWLPIAEPVQGRRATVQHREAMPASDPLLRFGPPVLALLLAMVCSLSLSTGSLKGKTIVAYGPSEADWGKPEHDAQATGSFGMLPIFIESLGGRLVRSGDLSANDLAQADVLLVLRPSQPWPEGVRERVWQFVRDGGSLLVAAEPEIPFADGESPCNALLKPTALRLHGDTAMPSTSHWEQACQALDHAATVGVDDRHNGFGLAMSCSLDVGWPGAPILVGRWGWAEPASDATGAARQSYESGKRLGDLVLVAEQRLGAGRIVLLGDTSSLHNDVITGSYLFAGRLLGYLGGDGGSPGVWWRQVLGLCTAGALVALLAWRASAVSLASSAIVLAGSLLCAAFASNDGAGVLPSGQAQGANRLAYIDASHMEAYSSDTWGDFGTGGLARTLMRNGYLPLLMRELSAERLEQAGLLISIAPARSFTADERQAVRQFVESGGVFVSMVGAEQSAGSREVLAEFGLRVPRSPVAPGEEDQEAAPLGSFASLYYDRDRRQAATRFYAAWPVQGAAERLVSGFNGEPVVARQPVGRGSVVLIGDTYFAVNQNLESATFQVTENIHFWRWLLARVVHYQDWVPPAMPRASAEAGEDAMGTGNTGGDRDNRRETGTDPSGSDAQGPADKGPADKGPAKKEPASSDGGAS